MSDIFISYARSTEVEAHRIAEALRALGYGVWRDDQLPAHRAYGDVIEERLEAAKAVVVVWSAEAARSEWVRSEANRAREDHKLVQLTVDGAALPMPFDQIQCADLKGWSGDLDAPGWCKVVASIADLAGQTPTAPAPAPLPLPSKPSIAVMPFANLSGDPEQEYFADGMVEEIVTALSRFPALFVIGAGSGLSFRDSPSSRKQIAQALGVRYLLEGSVRRSGERVRISVNLTDAVDGQPIWAERFDGGLEDVFALQDIVANAVAGQLEPNIEGAEIRRADTRPTQDLGAYDLYLRAFKLFRVMEAPALEAAVGLVDQAIGRDPAYALARALAGAVLTIRVLFGWSRDPGADSAAAAEHTRLALLARADDPDVLRLAALVTAYLGDDPPTAEAMADRALALNPGAALSWAYSGYVRIAAGGSDLAVEHLQTALRLDPRTPDRPFILGALGDAMVGLRRFDEAVKVLQEALNLRPANPSGLASLFVALVHLERIDEARTVFRALRAVAPAMSSTAFGQSQRARSHMRELYREALALAGDDD